MEHRQVRQTVVLRGASSAMRGDTALHQPLPPTTASEPQLNPVSVFLASLQLQGYVEAFVVEHGFRTLELIALHVRDESDLIEIGVRPLAHRRTLMSAINKMRKSWIMGGLPLKPKQTTTKQRNGMQDARGADEPAARPTVALPLKPTTAHSSFSQQIAAFRMKETHLGGEEVVAEEGTAGAPCTTLSNAPASQPCKEEYVVVLSAGTNPMSANGETVAPHHDSGGECVVHHGSVLPDGTPEPSLTARDQLAEALSVAEASYQTAMRQLREDAEAAAASLSEQFSHRANAIEDRRQMHLDEVEQLCVDALSRRHHRNPTSEEVAATLDDAVALSLRGTPNAVVATPAEWHRPGYALQGCHVSITVQPMWRAHPQPATATVSLHRSQTRGADEAHTIEPCEPTPTRAPTRSASVKERSGTNRASLRRVEAWLEDNADVICLSPSLEDDEGPSNATTTQQKAPSHQQHIIDLLSSAEGGSAMMPTPPTPGVHHDATKHCETMQAEDDDGDVILEHISCSQVAATAKRPQQRSVGSPPMRREQAPPSSSAADFVDVDACSTNSSEPSLGAMENGYGFDVGASTFFCPADVSNSSGSSDKEPSYGGLNGDHNVSFSPVEMQPFDASILFPDDSNSVASLDGSRTPSVPGCNAGKPPRSPVPPNSEQHQLDAGHRGPLPQTTCGASPFSRPPFAQRAANVVQASTTEGGPTSIVGRLWHSVGGGPSTAAATTPFHRQYSLDAMHAMPMDEVMALCAANGLACVGTTVGEQLPQKRPREEQSNALQTAQCRGGNCPSDAFPLPRTALLTLYARSLFLDATRQLLERVPAFSGAPVKGKHDASLSRLLQAEKDALTQTELNDVRRRIKAQEAMEANENIVASLVHDSMEALMTRVHYGYGYGAMLQGQRLAVYEQVLLRDGVDVASMEALVHKDFPNVPKSRMEGLLKANGVPIDVVRHSPAAVKRHRYFTTKGGRKGKQ